MESFGCTNSSVAEVFGDTRRCFLGTCYYMEVGVAANTIFLFCFLLFLMREAGAAGRGFLATATSLPPPYSLFYGSAGERLVTGADAVVEVVVLMFLIVLVDGSGDEVSIVLLISNCYFSC